MKNYPVKIMNVSDLMKFNAYVRKNHIKGEVVQNKYRTGARNLLGLLIVLPLDDAELVVSEQTAPAVEPFGSVVLAAK